MNHAHISMEAEGKSCCCFAVAKPRTRALGPALLCRSLGACIHRVTPHFTSNWEICLVFQQNTDNPDDEGKSIG